MTDVFLRAHEELLAGRTTCQHLAQDYLERIDRENPRLNAFVHVDHARTLAAAEAVDAKLSEGKELPLAGMMLAVKDVICEAGAPVSCSSRILGGFESLIASTGLQQMLDAGAVVVGRTNCDEFAMGSSNENSVYGPVRNPRDLTRVPGGSSGGSAAAVAAELCHVALGSDTGGSIRQPASFCGVAGLKPTYGRVSRFGLVAYASSFDSIGPFTMGLGDMAAVLSVLAGTDPRDNTSADVPMPDFAAALDRGLEGMRIGLPEEYFGEGLDPVTERVVRASIARMKDAGAVTVPVSLPHTRFGIAAYYILTTAEASSNLARYDGVRYGYRSDRAPDPDESDLHAMYTNSRSEGFGAEVKRRIMLGTYALSSGYYDAYYARAQRVRTLIRRDFSKVFEEVDILATPATPGPAFPLGSRTQDPLAMYLSDVYTVTANLAGIPGLVVPAGQDDGSADGSAGEGGVGSPLTGEVAESTRKGLPIGIQLLGPAFSEPKLLRAGRVAWPSFHDATS